MSARERFWRFIGRFDPFAKGSLSARDLRRHPIWQFAIDSEGLPWRDETWRRPLKRKTIPWNEYSMTVRATMRIQNGQQFEGDAHVTTVDGVIDVFSGGISVGTDWFFVPLDSEKLAAALRLPIDQVLPIRWQFDVPLEGESTLRSGELRNDSAGE